MYGWFEDDGELYGGANEMSEYESWDDGGANSSSDSKMGTYGPSQSPLILVIMERVSMTRER